MKKNTLFIFILLSNLFSHSQALYDRVYGSLTSAPGILGAVNPKTGEYFYVLGRSVRIANPLNATNKAFYSFPQTIPEPVVNYNGLVISKIMFDNNENLIVYGRTHNPNFGTSGVYSPIPVQPHLLSGHTFIAKINRNGTLVWLTYFHDLLQDTDNLAIDSKNNIYVLTKHEKTTVLSPSYFQNTGDQNSIANLQEVISKISADGKNLLWSTFYHSGSSKIKSIKTSADGLFVLGEHFGATATSDYFGTKGSYQEKASGYVYNQNDNTNVFISKFNFNGTRAWSSYYGKQRTSVPFDYSNNTESLITIGNDVYFLSTHVNNNTVDNMATTNSYISTPPYTNNNITLAKFLGDGKHSWTTYLYTGQTLKSTHLNEPLILGQININNTYLQNLITQNAYQKQHGGNEDIYLAILNNDGKSIKYGSFYGASGEDISTIMTNNQGFYLLGVTKKNTTASDVFSSTNELTPIGGISMHFGYFIHKTLNVSKHNQELVFGIYPNPTSDVLNITSKIDLYGNTQLNVFDVTGRIVLSKNSDISYDKQINVSSLPTGAYILQIKNETYNESIKFIKR